MPDDPPPLRLPQTVADILESMSDAFVALDKDWRYVYVNRRAGEMFGRAPEDLVGKHIWTEFPEGVGQPFHRMYERAMAEQATQVLEEFYPPYERWFENRIYPSPNGLTIFFQDITERKVAEQELARSELRYRTLAHAFSSVVWDYSVERGAQRSQSWEDLTGREGTDSGWHEAVHDDDRERVVTAWDEAVRRGEEYDATFRLRGADGSWRTVRARGVPVVEDGTMTGFIGVVDDITDQVRVDEALRRAALEDPLTGLPNRAGFLERVGAALAHRDPGPIAVLYLDVDRFKAVNDAFGHAGGDAVLREVADRLRRVLRPSDVITRLSGDEFAVLCDALPHEGRGVAIAARLVEEMARPMPGSGTTVSVSVGVRFVGPDDRDAERLLRDADAAMYAAKARGGGTVEVLDEALREVLHRRQMIERELRAALGRGDEVGVHYQPAVSFARGWASVAEALLRFRASDGTVLPAQEVVSVAEETGMIVALGARVLEQACGRAAAWNAGAAEPLAVSVNVSVKQLARPAELLEQVRSALERSSLPAELLWLEITESTLMEHRERSAVLLGSLRELGVNIALDDFGVGYSSLAYLHGLTVDAVKIDRSFIAGLPGDAGAARIVEAVVAIGRAFRTGVVAEGVETDEQLMAIRAAGCTGAQGYGLARPVPASEVPSAFERAERWVST